MSTALVESETPAPPKPLPAGVSNLLTIWWLTIVFTGLAAITFWPELPGPITNAGGVTGLGSAALWAVILGLLGVGSVVGYTVATGRKIGLTILKVGAIVCLVVCLGVVVMACLKDRGKDGLSSIFEPVPMFVGSFLAMIVLLPLCFGTMALLTLGNAEDIQEFFAAPAGEETGTGQYIVPAVLAGAGAAAAAGTISYRSGADEDEAAVGVVESPAEEEAVEFEEAAEAPADEEQAAHFAETRELSSPLAEEDEVVVDFSESPAEEAAAVTEGEADAAEFVAAEEAPTETDEGVHVDFVPAEEVTDVEADAGEVFEFEIAPEDEEPPAEGPKKTKKKK
jgi:hypothetical protein